MNNKKRGKKGNQRQTNKSNRKIKTGKKKVRQDEKKEGRKN